MEILSRSDWEARAAAHAARVDVWIQPHLDRRRAGQKHPVHDFLFTYYSQSPAALRRWHPGYGIALENAAAFADSKPYSVVEERAPASVSKPLVAVSSEHLLSQQPLIESIRRLLVATAGRTPTLGCFGLHEWAMVHRTPATRHDWPLRLGADGTDEVVEQHRITCSHFDAYRFFTDSARPLNTLRPGRDDRASYEQPGCLHAGMDLYKHAFRLTPLVPSELVADCFELAWDIRILDMRAAPYDLTGLTLDPTGEPWTPVNVETPEGKRKYAELQREFAERAAPIRRHLTEWSERLLAGVGGP